MVPTARVEAAPGDGVGMAAGRGLSEREARARRAHGQGNDLPARTSRSYGQILSENVFTFMNGVIFGLGLALVALGRVNEALVSVGVVLANTLVGVVQEVRAKRMLDRIALLTRPKATVVRDGREQALDPSEVVLGDVLALRPGDQVIADGPMVGPPAGRLEMDESLLTGESDLVPKHVGDPLYSGSHCVAGSGLYEAQRVGTQSLAHEIASGARAFRRVQTPLQQHLNLAIRGILLLAAFIELLLVADALLEHMPAVETVRMSVVVAGLVPNGLFLAIAAAYALGAVRMLGQGALVQQANAVESLSNVDVLCLDKTGTLTANRFRLEEVHPLGVSEEALWRSLGDYAASTGAANRTTEAIAADCPGRPLPLRGEVPFSSARKWSAVAFADAGRPGAYVLGAPEVLAAHLRPGPDAGQEVVEAWAARGWRILLLAHSPHADLSTGPDRAELPAGLSPLGLVSLSDALRPQARETLHGFAEAGIALKIISGDSPHTVAALARQAGLGPGIRQVSGTELAGLDGDQLAQAAEECTIFGRVTPQQKEALVRALQARGHYVAMIGDGVNDVLSLKRSSLGIALQSGTAAARGVADIVLLDDSFASLPPAFLEGQRIRNGMQDILKLFITRVLYASLLILSVAVLGGFPFTPMHNTVLTLFTVGIPSLALAAWARPGPVEPRSLIRGLLHFVLPATATLGLAALGVYLGYLISAYRGALASAGTTEAAAMASALPVAQSALTSFTVICGLLLIPFAEPPTPAWVGGDVLSGDRRPAYLALALLGVYGAVLALPPLRAFFDLVPLTPADYALLCVLAAVWAVVLRTAWRARILERFLTLQG